MILFLCLVIAAVLVSVVYVVLQIPKTCYTCGRRLLDGEKKYCSRCREQLAIER